MAEVEKLSDRVKRMFERVPMVVVVISVLIALVGYAIYVAHNHGIAQIIGGLVITLAASVALMVGGTFVYHKIEQHRARGSATAQALANTRNAVVPMTPL